MVSQYFVYKSRYNEVRDNITLADVRYFFETICFPRTRANCKQILESWGMDFYCPEIIVRKTQGRMSDDHFD